MKQVITLVFAVVFFASNAWAQCTPNAPSGNPGITPPTDSLACVEVGRAYSQVIQIENFNSFTLPIGTASVQSLRVDSITNIPCGLSYVTNPANATFGPGQTGCILVSGTSFENVGQYRLNIYVDVQVLLTTPFGSTTLPYNGEAADVVNQIESATGQSLGVDFNYFLRVIEVNDPCPAIDRTGTVDLTATPSCAPPVFTATITGNTAVCPGQTTTLTVNFTNGVAPYDILWTGGSTATTVTVGAGTHTITAIDSNSDTATATVTVTELLLPVAEIDQPTISAGTVDVTSPSVGDSYSWDFGGQGTATGASASYTFSANGTYDVTLIVTNGCGADTITESVTISGIVGINELGSTLAKVQVVPNPSNGNITISVVANESSPVNIRIFNLQGQQVYANTLNLSAGQASSQAISLGNAASGVYILQVQANDALVTEKLMVK